MAPSENLSSFRLSRRDLLGKAGQGALSLAAFALFKGTADAAGLRTRLKRSRPLQLGSNPTLPTRLSVLQWGDSARYNQPEYYETLGVGDVDGDGQDELIIRSSGGLLVQRFDPSSGQWLALAPNGPPFSDANGWSTPGLFQTIRCADVNGDGKDEIIACGFDGIIGYEYDNNESSPTYRQFTALPRGIIPPDWIESQLWTQPQYYTTFQYGDIDGDGREELVVRLASGIYTYKYTSNNEWILLEIGTPFWADFGGITLWNLPQYYETIRLADIDGDGHCELLGRSSLGVEVWKWNGSTWNQLTSGSILSDADGWGQPAYYSTIQCADIDGDGAKELVVRGGAGISAFKWDSGSNAFDSLPICSAFSDANGWNQSQYYSTLITGDIDGDGSEEIIGRNAQGAQTWKYFSFGPYANQWLQMAGNNPSWTDDGSGPDANGTPWDQVEYFTTLRFARTHPENNPTAPFPNPNTGPTHDGSGNPRSGPYATLIGRDQYGIQTWRYQQNDNERESGGFFNWTSAPMPDFTSANANPDFVAGMNYLTEYWNLFYGNIRWHYNDSVQANFQTWYTSLYNSAPGAYSDNPTTPSLAQPSTVKDPFAWTALCWQLYWELRYCEKVLNWYGTLVDNLIRDMAIADNATLNSVQSYLSIPENSNNVGLNIAELVSNGAWAVLGFSELDMNAESSIGGILATIFGTALAFLPGGGESFQGTVGDIQSTLTDTVSQEHTTNGKLQLAITGGSTKDSSDVYQYTPGDFGMLAAVGQSIESTAWNWPVTQGGDPDNTGLVQASQRVKAIAFWQALVSASNWRVSTDNVNGPPSGYPQHYLYYDDPETDTLVDSYWLGTSSLSENSYVSGGTQGQLFGDSVSGATFPLGVPLADVFTGQNQWPTLPTKDWTVEPPRDVTTGAPLPRKPTPTIRLVTMTREMNGAITVELRVTNRALQAGTNVVFSSATLGNIRALAPLPRHLTYLAPGKSFTVTLRFPASMGVAGKATALRLSGKYKGGTFGGSFRVRLP